MSVYIWFYSKNERVFSYINSRHVDSDSMHIGTRTTLYNYTRETILDMQVIGNVEERFQPL